MKRMIITKNLKGAVLVCGESAYNTNNGMGKPVTKKKNLSNINPTKIPMWNVLSTLKKTDVNNLLVAHYGEEWKNDSVLFFYKFALEGDAIPDNAVEEVPLCEHVVEEEINVAV
ncbi:unnamed protein product [Psylliodes chrysocephalus]|uniref:Uncharacterized protein n=1 Tax=Psylliodes chrysocephalus TaxID=3402493 RepID=A0A9P0D3I8_9CUCU|nr:unnamed protein product [Psylliodes chrysocephala]